MDQERPFLGFPLPVVPPDKPTTQKNMLQALYGHFNGNLKFFTAAKLSCSRRNNDNSARCEGEDGCSRLARKCFLYQVSNVWKAAGVPVKKDKAIVDNVIAVKTKYQKILKNKHKLHDAEKQEYQHNFQHHS